MHGGIVYWVDNQDNARKIQEWNLEHLEALERNQSLVKIAKDLVEGEFAFL
jgi:hypothetical protein